MSSSLPSHQTPSSRLYLPGDTASLTPVFLFISTFRSRLLRRVSPPHKGRRLQQLDAGQLAASTAWGEGGKRPRTQQPPPAVQSVQPSTEGGTAEEHKPGGREICEASLANTEALRAGVSQQESSLLRESDPGVRGQEEEEG